MCLEGSRKIYGRFVIAKGRLCSLADSSQQQTAWCGAARSLRSTKIYKALLHSRENMKQYIHNCDRIFQRSFVCETFQSVLQLSVLFAACFSQSLQASNFLLRNYFDRFHLHSFKSTIRNHASNRECILIRAVGKLRSFNYVNLHTGRLFILTESLIPYSTF